MDTIYLIIGGVIVLIILRRLYKKILKKPVRPHCNCGLYAPDVDKYGWCKECRPEKSEE